MKFIDIKVFKEKLGEMNQLMKDLSLFEKRVLTAEFGSLLRLMDDENSQHALKDAMIMMKEVARDK